MDYLAITINAQLKDRDELILLLDDFGIQQIQEESKAVLEELDRPEISWDYVDPTVLDINQDELRLSFYLSEEEDLSIVDKIEIELKDRQLGTISKEVVKEEDWANNWKKYYKPIHVKNRLTIVPIWEDYKKQQDELLLWIDPGMAFGSGLHETTYMCMELIMDYIQNGDYVFDIGCGSGILSLVAAKMGAQKVIAVDLDPVCISATKNNSQLNQLEDKITPYQGNLLDVVEDKADLIVSNIIAEIIANMLPNLKDHLKPSGIFIASGIIDDKRAFVEKKLKDLGFKILEIKHKGEWYAIVAKWE